MTAPHQTLLNKLKNRIFPEVPDFYRLINDQAHLAVECTAALVTYMHSGQDEHASHVSELEHRGDRLKSRNLAILHHAFATPIDREDIYQAVAAIDDILNYAKTTVREMQVLHLTPDEHTLAMATLMHEGALALERGFAKLKKTPLAAEVDASAAHKTERSTEKVYRKALAELFNPEHYLLTLTAQQKRDAEALGVLTTAMSAAESAGITPAVGFMLEILKRREVYRHMSNGADRVARAAEVLHDIVAKVG
jgi:uncharacterized protein Yka (UPF0111/DUF47 family)